MGSCVLCFHIFNPRSTPRCLHERPPPFYFTLLIVSNFYSALDALFPYACLQRSLGLLQPLPIVLPIFYWLLLHHFTPEYINGREKCVFVPTCQNKIENMVSILLKDFYNYFHVNIKKYVHKNTLFFLNILQDDRLLFETSILRKFN